MKFFKQNSYDIVKLFINQIGITIFSLFIYTAFGAIWFKDANNRSTEELLMLIGVSVFAMMFYFFLIYTATWDYGAKDKIRIDGGRMERDGLKGFKMGLFANVPMFVFAFISIVCRSVYMITDLDGFGLAASIFHFIIQLIASMYDGILQASFNAFRGAADSPNSLYFLLQEIGYFVLPFLAVLVAHLGYALGLREKKLFKSTAKNEK